MKRYVFVTENENGPQENTISLTHEAGELRIKLESAVTLPQRKPCKPCSTAEFVEHLNNLDK